MDTSFKYKVRIIYIYIFVAHTQLLQIYMYVLCSKTSFGTSKDCSGFLFYVYRQLNRMRASDLFLPTATISFLRFYEIDKTRAVL